VPKVIHLYLDDSGTRHPDRGEKLPRERDWFALGGVLVSDAEEASVRAALEEFRTRWPQLKDHPLHSYDIRHASNKFFWLKEIDKVGHGDFMGDLTKTLCSLPAVGIACVIDRPGYNERYKEKYGERRWMLCKTAFCIAVERAAKYAIERGAKLKVWAERASVADDRALRGYYDALRNEGSPFAKETSGTYQPLSVTEFRSVLYDFNLKAKSSPMAQVADMYLWPIVMGGYHASNRPYLELKAAGRLIDCLYPEDPTRGIKYSCFGRVKRTP
jgi:hypothetical protein